MYTDTGTEVQSHRSTDADKEIQTQMHAIADTVCISLFLVKFWYVFQWFFSQGPR
jgi:hypothetical protein